MTCTSPLRAYQLINKSIVFQKPTDTPTYKTVNFACGKCMSCRLSSARDWAIRCVHESKMHNENCVITLTYDDDHIPHNNSVRPDDLQKFWKRLRKFANKTTPTKLKYFACGEYGDKTLWPHYHACIFGFRFDDLTIYKSHHDVSRETYTSESLQKIWPQGHGLVGNLNFDSAFYVARYVTKKITGDDAENHYKRVDSRTGEIYDVEPEFCRMSTKTAIGHEFYEKYGRDLHAYDHAILNGQSYRVPKYYDKKLKLVDEKQLNKLKQKRIKRARLRRSESTPERLAVKNELLKLNVKRKLSDKI